MKLNVTVNVENFNRTLASYAAASKKDVKAIVGKKFRDVVIRARKYHLQTRPDILTDIKRQRQDGHVMISKRVLQRFSKSQTRLEADRARKQAAIAKGGKRAENAMAKMAVIAETLARRANLFTRQQELWEMELKQREAAAGRAGAWGWRLRGVGYENLVSGHRAAVVSRSSTETSAFIQITNTRPGIDRFTARVGYIDKALGDSAADMAAYLKKKFGIKL
jgi:hypothetical protein